MNYRVGRFGFFAFPALRDEHPDETKGNYAYMNAFATGPRRNNALVAVSSGLLRGMSRREAEAVLGHEISHVANGDMVTLTLIQGVVNTFVIFLSRVIGYVIDRMILKNESDTPGIGYWASVIVLDIVLGVLASIIVAWFSRQREFRADRGGATLAGRDRMIGALKRLAANRDMVDPNHASLATMKINGLRGWMSLVSTHPPLETRIAALERT